MCPSLAHSQGTVVNDLYCWVLVQLWFSSPVLIFQQSPTRMRVIFNLLISTLLKETWTDRKGWTKKNHSSFKDLKIWRRNCILSGRIKSWNLVNWTSYYFTVLISVIQTFVIRALQFKFLLMLFCGRNRGIFTMFRMSGKIIQTNLITNLISLKVTKFTSSV